MPVLTQNSYYKEKKTTSEPTTLRQGEENAIEYRQWTDKNFLQMTYLAYTAQSEYVLISSPTNEKHGKRLPVDNKMVPTNCKQLWSAVSPFRFFYNSHSKPWNKQIAYWSILKK